jgi:hypothetical protein
VEFQTQVEEEGDQPSGKILGTVVLPVPNNISDTNTADWGADSMNAVQAAVSGCCFSNYYGVVLLQDWKVPRKSLMAIGNRFRRSKDCIRKAEFAAAAVQGEGAKLLSRASGQIVNPNLELLFNGPHIKTF